MWPSDRPAVNGETVATFPLNNYLRDRTYPYHICEQSFPEDRGSEWASFINYAMGHWAAATDGLIRMEHLDDIPEGSGICADFSSHVDKIVDDINAMRTNATSTEAHVESVLDAMHGVGMRRTEQVTANEIWMIHDSRNLSAEVLYEVSRLVARGTCRGADACAHTVAVDEDGAIKRDGDWLLRSPGDTYVHPDYDYYSDILLSTTLLGDLSIPDTPPHGVRLVDINDTSECPKIYRTLLHEAGHALGVGYRNTGNTSINFRDLGYWRNHFWSGIGPTLMWITSCTPTPFDIMAIYALYQTYQGAE